MWKFWTMTRTTTRTLAITTSLALGGFAPLTALALSPEAVWNELAQGMAVEQPDYTWEKDYPGSLSDGMSMTVTGFIVPVQVQAYFDAFLLVDDPQNCPFCGNGEGYGPVLEVQLKRAIPETGEFAQITVEGTLEFVGDEYSSQLFRLKDARVVD